MSNEIAQRTPAQELVAYVRSDEVKQQVAMALPPNVTLDRFLRITSTAILTNPTIADLDRLSIAQALVKAAGMGLMPDGVEAAITPRKGKAVLVPMIGGYRKKLAEHGWTLRTAVVYENDEFDHAVIDGEEKIHHRPVRPGAERGPLKAAYAIATNRHGQKMMTVLHPEDIAKRRASSSYDAVWNEHPAAMWEKSAGRDLYGQIGLPDLDESAFAAPITAGLAPGEAAATLYKIPAGGAAVPPAGDGTADPVGRGVQPSAPAAGHDSSAAGADADDEPTVGEVVGEQDSADEQIVEAGRNAAMFTVPNGKNAGKTLGEIHASGEDGIGWIRWALGKIKEPEAFRIAVWSYARVYLPEAYEEALRRQEAAA